MARREPDPPQVVELHDDPQFPLDVETAHQESPPFGSVVLDFAQVSFVNSSNIASLLRLRRELTENDARMLLCNLNKAVSGVFEVTGLDKVFEFADSVLQAIENLEAQPRPKRKRTY